MNEFMGILLALVLHLGFIFAKKFKQRFYIGNEYIAEY